MKKKNVGVLAGILLMAGMCNAPGAGNTGAGSCTQTAGGACGIICTIDDMNSGSATTQTGGNTTQGHPCGTIKSGSAEGQACCGWIAQGTAAE